MGLMRERQSIRGSQEYARLFLNGLSAWLRKLRIPESGDYRDSDLYRELWADARKVVDDAFTESTWIARVYDKD